MLSFFLITSFIVYLFIGSIWSNKDLLNVSFKLFFFFLAFIAAYLIFSTRALGVPTIPAQTQTVETTEQ
jgi:hypothetical protein